MATPVLNNGIFLRDTSYAASSHVDSYHLVNMLKDAEPMDLGPVDLWAMAQKVEMPLYQLSSFGGKNVINVDNARGEYKWQTPVSIDLPYIIEDIEPENDFKGVEGIAYGELTPGNLAKYAKMVGEESAALDVLANSIEKIEEHILTNGAVLVFSKENRNVFHEIIFKLYLKIEHLQKQLKQLTEILEILESKLEKRRLLSRRDK
jgi:hypothetical protein